jgi:hypothetical protein
MKSLSSASLPGILASFWSACFVITLGIPFLLLIRSSIESSTLPWALDQISTLYAPNIGAVLTYYFAKPGRPRRLSGFKSGPFLVALLASAIWNAVVAGTLLLVPMGQLHIEDALRFANTAGPKLSWLVAPALGYFFAKPGEAA